MTMNIVVTDQRDRDCGWVCHVKVEADYGSETIYQKGGFSDERAAKDAAASWVRDYCNRTLAALPGVAQGAPVDPRVKNLAEKIRTSNIDQIGAARFAILTVIIPEAEIDDFADALCSVTSTERGGK